MAITRHIPVNSPAVERHRFIILNSSRAVYIESAYCCTTLSPYISYQYFNADSPAAIHGEASFRPESLLTKVRELLFRVERLFTKDREAPFRPERPHTIVRGASFRPERSFTKDGGASFRPERPSTKDGEASFRPERPSTKDGGASFRPERPFTKVRGASFRPERPSTKDGEASFSHIIRHLRIFALNPKLGALFTPNRPPPGLANALFC